MNIILNFLVIALVVGFITSLKLGFNKPALVSVKTGRRKTTAKIKSRNLE